jgi:RTX calcium-binding nonapeptide repeat (4 copies)
MLLVTAVASAACQGKGTVDNVTALRAALTGGDSHDVTTSPALPARAVGRLNLPAGVCTATPILRDVIVTAGHCLCVPGGRVPLGCDPGDPLPRNCPITFRLPHADATGAIVDVGVGGAGIGVKDAFCKPGNLVSPPPNTNEPANSAADIAIVRLLTPLNTTDLPQLPEIYTNKDFLDQARNRPPTTFFGGPIQSIGYDASPVNTPRKNMGTIETPLAFDDEPVFCPGTQILIGPFFGCPGDSAPGIWIHDNINATFDASRTLLSGGDSGAPITFFQNGSRPTIFGVGSIFHNPLIDDTFIVNTFGSFESWSPTWDNGTQNGAFIRQFLPDADGDGVSDATDNCTPPRCTTQGTCFNPDQTDLDLDGIGDACDNCPPSICTSNGVSALFCTNPSQTDVGDRDGIGDICDRCPTKPSSAFEPDRNGNGVGDSCDLCPQTAGGGRRACKTTADCGGRGRCITTDLFAGRCTDGTNRVCGNFLGVQCSCTEIGQWGACTEDTEVDTDGDLIGDRCDSCRLVADDKLQQNSNLAGEVREGAPKLNDACDAVPVFTARPVVDTGPNSSGRTLFTAFAGVGSETSSQHPPFPSDAGGTGAPVGFRHCSCAKAADEAACLTSCGTSRAAFDFPATTPWKQVTVGVSPAGIFNEAQVDTPSLTKTVNPVYAGGIDCSDPLPHQATTIVLPQTKPIFPPADRSLCHLGTATGRLLSWQTNVDIAAGRVAAINAPIDPVSGEPGQPQAVLQSFGQFWSHGLSTPFASAGTRDTTFNGQLRDNYVYVKTPSRATEFVSGFPRIPLRTTAPGCLQCYPVISTDWLKTLIQPGFGLNVLRLFPRPFVIYPDCGASGTLCAIRRSTEPNVDLGLVLGPDARTALLDPGRTLITPVEPFGADTTFTEGLVAFSVPRSWSQLGSTIEGLGVDTFTGKIEQLATYQTVNGGENTTPFGGEGFVPSDREGARWLFSKLEYAMYMIGGTIQGVPTSEIWHLDLRTAVWKHLFAPDPGAQVGVRNVAAVAYDTAATKLVVIDDLPASSPQTARVVAFDARTESSRVLTSLDLSSFVKVGLTATGGGSFVLVGAKQTSWTAYRFQITSQNTIVWLGKTSGQGFVVADPLPWQEGPGVFTQTGQDLDTVDLPPGAFTPAGAPPELKICDAPLVVPAPPPVVVTKCHTPALTPPTPSSACGPVSVDRTAPSDFPLGATTITWRLTDVLGNTVSVAQTVIAVLGDDASCCPAGTHVIVGTSNNDNITGTSGADCILALGGQDTVNGGGGDDIISGGEGNDVIHGGTGNDRIYGGGGQDLLYGDDGNDSLSGDSGDDQCYGGIGNDVLSGGDGQDTLNGEDGADQVFGDNGDDRLSGGPGNDVLNGGAGHNACSGGTGTNQFLSCETFF